MVRQVRDDDDFGDHGTGTAGGLDRLSVQADVDGQEWAAHTFGKQARRRSTPQPPSPASSAAAQSSTTAALGAMRGVASSSRLDGGSGIGCSAGIHSQLRSGQGDCDNAIFRLPASSCQSLRKLKPCIDDELNREVDRIRIHANGFRIVVAIDLGFEGVLWPRTNIAWIAVATKSMRGA